MRGDPGKGITVMVIIAQCAGESLYDIGVVYWKRLVKRSHLERFPLTSLKP